MRVARLGRFGEREEAAAQVFEALAERLVDAVADDVEEAVRAAGFADPRATSLRARRRRRPGPKRR